MKRITVIHCWSAPRSRSTALLYSFEARGANECCAIDEPLYREWLIRRGDAVARPYRDELINGVPPPNNDNEEEEADRATAASWRRELLSLEDRLREASGLLPDAGVVFCKHMAKHSFIYDFENEVTAPDLDVEFEHRHLLLIRDPVDILSSWGKSSAVHGNNPTPDEIGIVPLLAIYSALESRRSSQSSDDSSRGASSAASSVVLLDSDELVSDPETVLAATCGDLGIAYAPSMMTWESGPHPCDGPWAKWWYHDVHATRGWNTGRHHGGGSDNNDDSSQSNKYYGGRKYRTLDPGLMPALSASFPAYQFLSSLTRRYQDRGPPPAEKYEDPRNEHVLAWVGAPRGGGGRLVPRDLAGVSPWDSSVQGGDACWEGIRVYSGKILSLEKHLQRLFHSAKALGFENVHTKEEIKEAIFRTLAANGMRDGTHMRLTLTRGEKCTSSMNPKFNVYGTTLIVLAEWKPTEGATTYDNTAGISLITAAHRRNSPQTGVDSKIHHNNMINNILPKMQANLAGCADALMLDTEGYVAETNATNLFMVTDDADGGAGAKPTPTLVTPEATHCLPGITRATVLELSKELGIPSEVRRVSLAEFYAAAEVFTTGTMGELTPVCRIDGRIIGSGKRGPVTKTLADAYKALPSRPGWSTDLPDYE